MKGSRIVNNTIWIMVEKIVQLAISLIVGMISARYLGPTNYGVINIGAAYVSIFGIFSRLGIEAIIVKEFVDNPDESGRLIGTTVFLRMISSGIAVIMIWCTTILINGNNSLLLIVTMLQSVSIFFQSVEVFDQWYQSKLQSKKVSIARSIAYVFVAVYKIVLLICGMSVKWFAFATTLEYLVLGIVLICIYKYDKSPKMGISWNIAKRLLQAGFPFIWSGMISVLYMQMDKMMLGKILDETSVGLYSAASTVGAIWGFVVGAIIDSMRPVIVGEKKKSEEGYKNSLIEVFSVVLYMGAIISIGMMIFSKLIMLVLYGEQYMEACGAMMILSWSTVFAYLGTARGIYILCEELNSYTVWFIAMGGIINTILNFILINCVGMNGAAIATLATQIFVSCIAPVLFKKTRGLVELYIKAINPQVLLNVIKRNSFKKKINSEK